MNIAIYSLSYCEHCLRLKQGLKDAGIEFDDIDADNYYDETIELEELLSTKNYPILVIEDSKDTIYFINESRPPQKIKENVYTISFPTIDSLLLQVKNYIK